MYVPLSRRRFLERAALGAAAVAATRSLPIAAAPQPPSGMFISMAPWATARGVGWPDQARLAAKVGYKGIDYAWGPAKAAGAEATRALMKELGIVPTICNLPTPNPLNGDDAAFKARLATVADDAALSAAFGSRRFQLVLSATTPGGQSKEERWKIVRDRLAAISEVFVKHDVHLSLEFLGPMVFRTGRGGGSGRRGAAPPDPDAGPPPAPMPFVWTLTETARLCQDAGPNIGVTLDAWHWFHSGGTVADILATPHERIVHVHVSDARQMPPAEVQDNMRLLPGEGVIDLVGFFQALRKIGWQGGVACETIGPRLDNVAPEEQARLGLETTTAVMKKAGVL